MLVAANCQTLPTVKDIPRCRHSTYVPPIAPPHRRAVLQECILRGTPEQLAGNCTQDGRCVAWIWKDLFWRESPGAGILRGVEGADLSRMVHSAASTTYFKQTAAAAPSTAGSTDPSSTGGLSSGAIAGIVVAAVAAARVAALGGWVLLRRRRRQQGSRVRTVAPAASAVSGKTGEGGDALLLPMPPSPDSCQDRQHSGQRSMLGTSQASSITANHAAAATSMAASSSSEAGAAAPVGAARPGHLRSTGSGSIVLGHAVIGRPVAPSPFVAARQLRIASGSSTASRCSSAAGGASAQASMGPSSSWSPDSMGFPGQPGAPRAERTPSAARAARPEAEHGPELRVELPPVSSACHVVD